MTFEITLQPSPVATDGEKYLFGKIQIGEFREGFRASLDYWHREQYLDNWRHSFTERKKYGDRVALVTSMHDPLQANFYIVWILYFEKEIVYFRNSILFLEEIKEKFNVSEIAKYARQRKTYTDEGAKISEWSAKLDDVLNFFEVL